MLNRLLITLGKPIDKDEWLICISRNEQKFTINCSRFEWADPCYGTELEKKDIKELIIFLHETLIIKEKERVKANLE